MSHYFKRIFRNVSVFVDIMLALAWRIDYKNLSQYLIRINQTEDLDGMLREVSNCLKAILNYKIFAFALQDRDQFDAWIDPGIYKKQLEKIIEKDFANKGMPNWHYLHKEKENFHGVIDFESTDLLSYGLKDEKYFAKLYTLPGRKVFSYHGEIMKIVTETFSSALSNLRNIRRLKDVAAIDPLTNCYNRREFNRQFGHYFSNAQRYGFDLAIVMFDIDHFKKVNDTYGHQTGDKVLKAISQKTLNEIRKGDFLYRYGGEEFLMVLPHTKKTKAMELANRLRRVFENFYVPLAEGKGIRVTASFGVASLTDSSDKESLLEEADAMLYKAKAGGRNRIMPQLRLLPTGTPAFELE